MGVQEGRRVAKPVEMVSNSGGENARAELPPAPGRDLRQSTVLRVERLSRPLETALIRYVAELVGADTDSERAIRWLIALMVSCSDPLAIAPTAATRFTCS
jgi:hypothetical protein